MNALSDIVFANSTCFDDCLVEAISNAARGMKSAAKIITLSHKLSCNDFDSQFQIVYVRQYVMSWGLATCYIHEKL